MHPVFKPGIVTRELAVGFMFVYLFIQPYNHTILLKAIREYIRGGKGTLGEAGHHHDFIMATVVL